MCARVQSSARWPTLGENLFGENLHGRHAWIKKIFLRAIIHRRNNIENVYPAFDIRRYSKGSQRIESFSESRNFDERSFRFTLLLFPQKYVCVHIYIHV